MRKLEEQKANKIAEIQQLGRQNKHLHNENANLVRPGHLAEAS